MMKIQITIQNQLNDQKINITSISQHQDANSPDFDIPAPKLQYATEGLEAISKSNN